MKRSSISIFGAAILILTILLSNQPTAVHAAAQLYFTNFDTNYSDWTATSATGGISLAMSPVITGSSVHIINTGNITRTPFPRLGTAEFPSPRILPLPYWKPVIGVMQNTTLATAGWRFSPKPMVRITTCSLL